MKNVRVHEALSWASLFLQEHNREQPVAEIVLMHHLGIGRTQFLAALRDPVPVDIYQKFQHDIRLHATTGVPVQHLIGKESFYGRDFYVNNDVLIPRPETEELVHGVLQYLDSIQEQEPVQVVDIGTGSGIIAISLKIERPHLDVSASDLSTKALQVAQKNADSLGADVTFQQGDLLEPFVDQGEKFQVIVSNPPYIAESERDLLADTVKNFDPDMALFADDNGLAAYKKIVQQSTEIVDKQALLAFEIGYQQGEQVRDLIKAAYPQSKIEVRKDINGKDRMVFAKIN
ncbi:peptide chain release factor N(5)-glutamine methyltransferase [Aquibacillus sediminis]|uniref:peptide chain release factor N(5)-glutamine methyltransferase n=1 Tax=Aquibacillus sediminis TaxID=2574734 RepID=UPI0011085804|nr:peptide chain release factor N(5)-glutamine methyltransferase [Aquibacillus sediminis]